MATANYDEVTHSAGNVVTDWNSIDPLYKWDPHFPERLSRLHVTPSADFSLIGPPSVGATSGGGTPTQRRQRRGRNRNTSRFKTQPITFDEIKEVDEEPRNPNAGTSASGGATDDHLNHHACHHHKDGSLKSQFAAFSRSMDGLVPGFPVGHIPSYKDLRTAAKMRTSSASEASASPSLSMISASTGDPGTTAATVHNGTDPLSAPTGTGSGVEPEVAAAAPSSGTSAAATAEEAAVFAAMNMNPTLAQVQDISRARRKKRRSRKSIEEEPELEKIATAQASNSSTSTTVDSQSAG